jgi:hypothetical protein
VWREAVGLPITSPYSQGVLGREDYISPQQMIESEDVRDNVAAEP